MPAQSSTTSSCVAVTAGPGLIGALLVGARSSESDRVGDGGCRWRPSTTSRDTLPRSISQPDPARAAVSLPARERWSHDAARRSGSCGQGPQVLGTTLDDAAGRPSTRARACSGSAIPGGAAIDRARASGDAGAYDFPVARVPGLDFSFSGLKTALLYAVSDLPPDELERRARRSRRELPARRSCALSSSGAARLPADAAHRDRRRRRRGCELGAARCASRDYGSSRRCRSARTTRR